MIGWSNHKRGSLHSLMVTRWVTDISLVCTGGFTCVKMALATGGIKYFLPGEVSWDLGHSYFFPGWGSTLGTAGYSRTGGIWGIGGFGYWGHSSSGKTFEIRGIVTAVVWQTTVNGNDAYACGAGMVFRVNDLSIGGLYFLPGWGSHFGKEWVIRQLSGERPSDDIGALAFHHATISIILQN